MRISYRAYPICKIEIYVFREREREKEVTIEYTKKFEILALEREDKIFNRMYPICKNLDVSFREGQLLIECTLYLKSR